ncbi:HTTM domain-containing protein [Verrucomicrobiales bacterium]|nr:HTTM domain-containing protein [Verrucomicrobiales bacterium]
MNNLFVSSFLWCRRKFGQPVDGASLGLFRILWGVLMVWEGVRKLPKATGIYSPDYFHFKYSLTPFVEPLPANWMVSAEIWIMIIAAVMVTVGFGFRFFNTLFAVIFTHLFLIEKVYYNNHFYLTCLIAFMLSLTAADQCYSVKSMIRRSKGNVPFSVPAWNLIVLRMQVLIVYFFGGVAKLQGDWLQGEPLRHWLGSKPKEMIGAPLSWFPEILKQEWFVWSLSYGGFFFDLLIGFFLWNRKTFWPAVAVVVMFHVFNNALFKIGLFPFIGISLLVLFFEPHWPRPILAKIPGLEKHSGAFRGKKKQDSGASETLSGATKLASVGLTWFVLAYFFVQFLLPFRTISYGGNPSWAEVGHYYSWRMMLRDKDAYLKFVFNPSEAEKILEKLPPEEMPNIGKSHLQKMVKNPHMILQYAHALDDTFEENGLEGVEIRAVSIASLNGRPFQLMIDPSVNLAEASYGFFEVPGWIVPLEQDKRPGKYPDSVEERRGAIKKVFDSEVSPIISKIPKKAFSKPIEELLPKEESLPKE